MLLQLPVDLATRILADWLTHQGIACLDTAICNNHTDRAEFSQLLSSKVFSHNDDSYKMYGVTVLLWLHKKGIAAKNF